MIFSASLADAREPQSAREFTVIAEPPYPPGWCAQPHSHRQHEIILVREGGGQLNMEGETCTLYAGDVFYVPPTGLHGFASEGGVALMVIQFLDLAPSLAAQLVNSASCGRFALSALEKSRLTDLGVRLQQEIAGDLPLADVQCQALVEQIVVLLLRSGARPTDTQIVSGEQHRLIERALTWLHAHSHENILISDVAAHIGLSPVYFRQLFRAVMGVSPKQYLIALRLQASKCMLMHNRSVSEVAERSGFGSPQEFSKAFRHLTGLTPSEWKRANLLVAY